jgi:hypothetical protein
MHRRLGAGESALAVNDADDGGGNIVRLNGAAAASDPLEVLIAGGLVSVSGGSPVWVTLTSAVMFSVRVFPAQSTVVRAPRACRGRNPLA